MSVVEYSIKLQDMASPSMRRFTQTVQQSNSVVNGASRNMLRRFASTQRAIEGTARATRDMQRDIASLTRSVDSLTRHLERAARVKPGKGSMLDMVGGGKGAALMGAAVASVAVVTNSVGKALTAAFERQKIQASYNILAGGKEQGEAIVGSLKKLMRDTMLGGEVFDIAQTMMAFGVKGDITKRIEQMGNVAMGDAGRMQSLGLALSQMSAAGKLQGQDRLQMINAGWNPINTLAEMTGKSAAQLNDEMSKGLITSDMVWKALDYATREGGKYGGVLDAIANTPAGKQMLMMGQLEEAMVDIGNALMPIAVDVMNVVNDYVMPLVETYMPKLREAVVFVWNIMKSWLEALAPLKEVFASITTEGTYMNEHLRGTQDIWKHIAGVVGQALGFVARLVADIVAFANRSERLKVVWSAIQWTVKAVWTVVGWLVQMLEGLWNTTIKPMIDGALELENKIFGRFGRRRTTESVVTGSEPSSMPGIDGNEKLAAAQAATLATMQSANAEMASSAGGSVSSGGPKVVNVTVGKLLDSIHIGVSNLNEGAEEIEKIVLNTLARVLAQGATMAI